MGWLPKRLESLKNVPRGGRDKGQYRPRMRSTAEQWLKRELSIHAHVDLARIISTGEELYLGDWCARFDCAQTSNEGNDLQESRLLVERLGLDAHTPRGDDSGHHFAMLVMVRKTTKPTDSFRTVPATIRLIPLEQCSIGYVGNTGGTFHFPSFEVGPTVMDGELDLASRSDGERSPEATDQRPRQMIEGGPVIVDSVSENKWELITQSGYVITQERDESTDDSLIGIEANIRRIKLELDGSRVSIELSQPEEVLLKQAAIVLSPLPLTPGTREGSGTHGA
jgi:hypothetical protein